MRFDESDVRVGSFGFDNNGLKFGEVARGAEIISKICEWDVQSIGNSGKIFFDQRGIVTQQQKAEGGTIIDQHSAIAIEHAATRRDNWNGTHAVAFGHRRVFLGVDDLQLPKAK